MARRPVSRVNDYENQAVPEDRVVPDPQAVNRERGHLAARYLVSDTERRVGGVVHGDEELTSQSDINRGITRRNLLIGAAAAAGLYGMSHLIESEDVDVLDLAEWLYPNKDTLDRRGLALKNEIMSQYHLVGHNNNSLPLSDTVAHWELEGALDECIVRAGQKVLLQKVAPVTKENERNRAAYQEAEYIRYFYVFLQQKLRRVEQRQKKYLPNMEEEKIQRDLTYSTDSETGVRLGDTDPEGRTYVNPEELRKEINQRETEAIQAILVHRALIYIRKMGYKIKEEVVLLAFSPMRKNRNGEEELNVPLIRKMDRDDVAFQDHIKTQLLRKHTK